MRRHRQRHVIASGVNNRQFYVTFIRPCGCTKKVRGWRPTFRWARRASNKKAGWNRV